ncbi:inositol 1,4,5-trisphosphate-gated calcium channel ITPR2-like isoform X1 [Mytilus galloprovincialis]|uniref:inositol 1,4,5-trisphosphate-gated calcium channel ITPR2-like isoform X1 n=1 Tax=Mytilus galloprovincialis TaxID=29158 RepID=UPI003F7B9BF6
MGLLMRKRKKVEKPVTIKRGGFNGNVEQAFKNITKEMLPTSMDVHGMGKYLCIGDFICLYCEETEGYVYSIQSSCMNNGLNVYTNQDRNRPRNVPNPQVIVFQITIQNRYKLNKKLRKVEFSDIDTSEVHESSISNAASKKIKASAEAENKDNEAEQKRQFGKKVRYGEIIQLRHVFSGKYIHSSTTQTSQKDRNNMRISLLECNAKNAQFKILPRYKVKSEGEFVQLYDQVMLESIKSPGHFLHASEPYQIDHFTNASELNLGVERSSFTLVGSFRDYPDQFQFFRGGSVIRLFHKELEAYVIAQGLFDQEVTENVHFRIRAFDPYNPKTISPTSSGITYWQIEAESSILNGDVIKWEQQIRLRHMTNRKYLSLDNNLDVCLVDDNGDPRTVFRFHSVIKEQDEIKFESYTRIEHMLTGCWLHALKDQPFDRKTFMEKYGVQNMDTETTKLRHILASNESMYADAYTLQCVPQNDVQNFNYIAGIVPFLTNLIKDLNDVPALSARRTYAIVTALKDVKTFLGDKGLPVKRKQKLLRNLKVIDLLVDLVKCPLRTGEEQLYRIRIYKEAYDVLHAYMLGRSGKNALYMAKYIDFFQTQFTQKGGIGINVAQMIVELMRDKRKLVDRITTAHIDRFIHLLGETKNSIFLNLLQVLCVCDGVSIPTNQTYITEQWLRQDMGYKFHAARGQNLNREPNVMFLSSDDKESWVPMHQLDPCEAGDSPYRFLLNQLDLLKSLCFGRNDFAVHTITREKPILQWEDAYLCLTSTQLSDQLRAKYCEVIIAAFVEVGSNYSVLDQPELCFVYEFVGTKDGDRESTQDEPSHFSVEPCQGVRDLATLFPVLRDFIVDFMERNSQMIASEIGLNQLTEQLLCLLKHLVRFGYFGDLTEINKIIKPLIAVLDGSTDVPVRKDKRKGYSRDAQKLVSQYKSGGRYEPNAQTEAVVNAKYQGLQVLDFLLTFQRNLRLKTMVEKFKMIEFEQKRKIALRMTALMYEKYNPRDTKKKALRQQQKILNELREMFHASDIFDKDHYTKILMDIAEYKYDKMVSKSLDILNKAYSSQSDMFKLAEKAQLLMTSESIKVHIDVQRELPVLQRFVRLKANDYQVKVMGDILDEFIRLCTLQKGCDEPHFVNQKILLSHGVLDTIREILRQEIDPQLEEHYHRMKSIFSKSLKLVQVLSKDNKEVQESLFYHLDTLLEVSIVPSDLALAIKELFVANQTTCLKITESQIKKLVLLTCEHTSDAPEFADLLYTLVKVEGLDLNIKRNQSLVMKYIMQNYQTAAYILEKPQNEREQILTNTHSEKEHLAYYVRFVDLLAVCAQGENKFIESLCQTMLPIEELLWVVNHGSIDNIIKTPFVKFMHEVYLQFVGDIIESGAADLQHNKDMWEFLDELTRSMGRAVAGLDTHKNSIGAFLKTKPDRSLMSNETSAVNSLKNSVYFSLEAVLPFLKTYFTRVYTPEKEIYPDEIETANGIALAVAGLCEAVGPFLSDPIHMKTAVTTLTVLIPLSTEPKSLFDKILDKIAVNLNVTDTRSDIKKGNMVYYTTELQLNAKFYTFARNCNIINKGQNTVKQQTGYKSKREYTELGLSNEMPLGEEFQSLVKCFINSREKKPAKKYAMVGKLLQQLQISADLFKNSAGSAAEFDDLDIKCLQILRACIHNEERKLPEDMDSRAGESSVKRQLEHVKDVQNAVNNHDFVRKVLPHIARRNDALVREVLAMISGMLFNANRHVQKCMLEYFLSTREELFFMALRERMVIASNSIKEKRSLLAQHQAKVSQAKHSDDQECTSPVALKILQTIQTYDIQLKTERLHGWTLVGHASPPPSRKKKGLFAGKDKLLNVDLYQNGKTDLTVFTLPLEEADEGEEEKSALSDMMQYNDDGYIELVLELLARICDGQNADLQNYLREQPDNVKSFNIVAETTQFLNVVYSAITKRTIGLAVGVFSSLNEFCAGNQENRVVLYGNKIVDYINFILRSGDVGDCPPEKVLELRQIIGAVVLSMIEENGPEKTEVATEVKDTIDKQALLQCMTNCYKMCQSDQINLEDIVKTENVEADSVLGSVKNLASVGGGLLSRIMGNTNDQEREIVTETGYLFYLIWARMLDIDPNLHKKVKISPTHQKAIDFYKKSCFSIEIVKEDVLQKVNFRVENKSLLRDEVKENLKWNIDRTSPSNKIRDLMGWTSDILKDISYQRKILQKPISKMFTKLWLIWNFGAFFLSVAINLLMLYSWNAKASLEDYQKINGNQTIDWDRIADPDPIIKGLNRQLYDVIMYAFMGSHNFFSLMVLISYLLLNHPRLPTLADISAPFKCFSRKEENTEEGTRDKDSGGSRLDAKVLSFTTFYFLLFLTLSVLGTVYHGYFFAFHLLNIVVNNQLLSGVIKSVTQNGWSLLWVAILGLIVIYIYALIGFSLLRSFFDPTNYLYCHTLWQCTITVVRYGLIGDMFDTVSQSDDRHGGFAHFWPLVLYHVSFFIFITTIGLNIIFGIIVDTFSELRDLKWRAESDMRECCFICSRNSYDFEHTGKGFQYHVGHEHSMWAYILFFIHLDNVKPSDYTALELFVAALWKKENFDFFPMNRALCLASADDDANDAKLEEVLSKVAMIHRKQMEEDIEKKRRKEKLRQKRWHERHRAYVFDASQAEGQGTLPLSKRKPSGKTDRETFTLKSEDESSILRTEDDDRHSGFSDVDSIGSYDETPRRATRAKSATPEESTKL